MTENIIETIRKAVQDLVAPEVRQIKADVGALGAKVDVLDSKFESKFDALHAEYDALRSEVSSPRLWAPPTRDTRPWRVSVRQSVPEDHEMKGWPPTRSVAVADNFPFFGGLVAYRLV